MATGSRDAMTPRRAPSSHVLKDAEIAWVANQAGFGAEVSTVRGYSLGAIFVAIALAESDGNVYATNPNLYIRGNAAFGLWQILMSGNLGPARDKQFNLGGSYENLYEPLTNGKAAYAIYKGEGLSAWTAYTNRSYAQFLERGRKAALNPVKPAFGVIGAGSAEAETDTKIDVLGPIFNPLFDFVKKIGLQIAAFTGGGLLILVAIVLLAKKGLPVAKKVLK